MIFAIKTIICIAVIGPITAWAYHIYQVAYAKKRLPVLRYNNRQSRQPFLFHSFYSVTKKELHQL